MKNKILIITALIFFLVFVLVDSHAFAAFTFTTNAITGTAASTIDLGSGNALALQTSGGKVGVGTASPSAFLHVLGTTEQLRLGFDASNFSKMTVGSTGALTLTPSGNGTSAYNITKADGTTSVLNIDTTNGRIAVNSTVLPVTTLQARVASDTNIGFQTPAANFGELVAFSDNGLVSKAFSLFVDRFNIFASPSGITSIGIGRSDITAVNTLTLSGKMSIGSGFITNAAPTNGLIVQGNVGIGTTGPGAKLDIKDGHIASSQTTLPTTSVTGTGYVAGSLVTGSTDTKGGVTATVGANAGTVVVTFNTSYSTAPFCTVTPATATAQVDVVKMFATSGTGALTLNFVASPTGGSETFNYICLQ